MKMHRGEITLNLIEDKTELREVAKVAGLLSANFGLHKEAEECYIITHLPTGLSMCWVEQYNLARKIIEQLETQDFPIAWSKVTIYNSKQNAKQAKEIISTCRKEYWDA